jgi:hypothetical protein
MLLLPLLLLLLAGRPLPAKITVPSLLAALLASSLLLPRLRLLPWLLLLLLRRGCGGRGLLLFAGRFT